MDEMIPNTRYGSVLQLGWGLGVRGVVREYVAEFEEDFDVDAITSEVLAWINARLPADVSLIGDEVIGPAYGSASAHLSMEELAGMVAMDEATWTDIIERHDRTSTG